MFAEPLDQGNLAVAPRELATLVFLRPATSGTASAADAAPLNLYVNGRFLSSLLPGGYVQHNHCGGTVQIAAVFDDARIRHLGQRGQETSYPLQAGKTYYFEVGSNGVGPQAQLTPVAASKTYLGQYRRQSHVLTRAPNCGNVAPATVTAAAPVAPAAPVVMPAPMAAKPMLATPVVLAADRARAPIESWRAAWERGDYAAYTAFYAPQFKGAFKTREQWEAQRRARLNNSAKQIRLDNLALRAAGDGITARFGQTYRSTEYNDAVQKRLVWKDIGGDLKIVEETVLAAP